MALASTREVETTWEAAKVVLDMFEEGLLAVLPKSTKGRVAEVDGVKDRTVIGGDHLDFSNGGRSHLHRLPFSFCSSSSVLFLFFFHCSFTK